MTTKLTLDQVQVLDWMQARGFRSMRNKQGEIVTKDQIKRNPELARRIQISLARRA